MRDGHVGFYFEGGAWHSNKFTSDNKLTVRRATQGDKVHALGNGIEVKSDAAWSPTKPVFLAPV